ncbi:MAG: hypothetical protein IPK17_22390 [Chloroflexi bacterium]|uniref:hypothetical protein n=1 Tax=Candidatus Flexifilum breve TaxID=3140694 RepID=UPI003135B109|nr:hypothetical protein [Chloroflexota bacterium]
MEDGSISSVLLLIALILFHGGMELTYAVLTNVRRNALRERVESGDQTAKRILRLTENVPSCTSPLKFFDAGQVCHRRHCDG